MALAYHHISVPYKKSVSGSHRGTQWTNVLDLAVLKSAALTSRDLDWLKWDDEMAAARSRHALPREDAGCSDC